MKLREGKGLLKALGGNKYVLMVVALALVLMLLPSGKSGGGTLGRGQGSELASSGIALDTESARIGEFLSRIEGVGEAGVLLSAEGAVVVCQGADEAGVRYCVTNAVSAYTGLGSDKIQVIKMK